MADEIPHIDLSEFREAGFLQEANRQFFHPFGLALEMTVVEDGAGDAGVLETVFAALKDDARLGVLIQNEAGGGLPNDEVLARIRMIAERVALRVAPPGSSRISGVWDYRDDPLGIYFASPLDAERAEAIERLRLAHWDARVRLFAEAQREARPGRAAEMADVQPLDWTPPEE